MKTLIIIRHARSNDAKINETDFERSLSDRGKSEALAASDKILSKIPSIDLILSSSALRTKQTAEYFRKALNCSAEKIKHLDGLYLASAEKIEELITSVEKDIDSLMVVCHNPGITDFVNGLIVNVRIDNMPTCGIFCVSVEIDNWEEFKTAEKLFLFFDSDGKN